MATIETVEVFNYRSVDGRGASVDFPEGQPVVLFGGNNAGKSNLVKAIDLVLGERWPGSYQPDDHEFYGRKRDKRICIDVFFDDQDRFGRSFKHLKYRFDPSNEGDPTTFGGRPPLQDFHGEESYVNGDDRDTCVCITVGADRKLDYQLSYKSRYTFLSKLMRRFHKTMLDDDDTRENLEELFSDIKDEFHSVDEFSEFVDKLKSNLGSLISSMTHQLEVDFQAYNPANFFRALHLHAVDEGEARALKELGTGEEQLLAISFAQAYAQAFHGNIFLIIEEPEAHLHPVMQRWLAEKIHEMASGGLQILVTTHSPAFIDFLNFEGLVLAKKEGEATQTYQHSTQDLVRHCIEKGVPETAISAESVLPYYRANATDKLKRGFFANKIVLVEGKTEEMALPLHLREAGLDVLKQGVEVLGVQGKGNLAKWWRMFTLYDIPTYIVFDNDDEDDQGGNKREDALGALDVSHNDIRVAVGAEEWMVADQYCVFGVDYETSLRNHFEEYESLESEAAEQVGGRSKPLKAQEVARRMVYEEDHDGWAKFEELASAIREL